MTGLLGWAAIALVAGLALVILEVFIPSGGLLGFLAFTSLVISIVLAFMHAPAVGFGFLVLVMLALPTTIVFALNRLPHTPIGRRMILDNPGDEVLPEGDKRLRELVGQVGKAKTKMLPSGAITVGKRSIDAVSEGAPIDPGQLVRVVEVRGNRVVVSPIEEEDILSETSGGDDLSRPIESLGLDALDEPLS